MNRNSYDFRIKQAVVETRNPRLFEDFGVNPATAENWIYKGFKEPTHCNSIVAKAKESQRVKELEDRLAKAEALLQLYKDVKSVCEISLENKHVRDRDKRKKVLDAISKASANTNVSTAINFIGLSRSRYKRWRSPTKKCQLSGSSNCHRTYPNQLSPTEIQTMKKLVTSKKYAHYSTKSLHIRAKRDGSIHCCVDTWYKYIEKYDWKRPHAIQKTKKHPNRVKRASVPNEIIHIDVTQIRSTVGKTYFLQTVLDNYSRHILAWQLTSKISGLNTIKLIEDAAKNARQMLPDSPILNLVSDGGSENCNSDVKKFLEEYHKSCKHRIPKCHVRFSNNMLEVWFRLMKNTYLNFQPANSMKQLLRRIEFYVLEYNENIPLTALGGLTPKEAYLGDSIDNLRISLESQAIEARRLRLEENLGLICAGCG